jgi:hypothetical protein
VQQQQQQQQNAAHTCCRLWCNMQDTRSRRALFVFTTAAGQDKEAGRGPIRQCHIHHTHDCNPQTDPTLLTLLTLPPPPLFLPQVPALWNRSPEAAAAKLSALATELGTTVKAAAALLTSQPQLASVNMPGVVVSRVEPLAAALGVAIAKVGGKGGAGGAVCCVCGWVLGRGKRSMHGRMEVQSCFCDCAYPQLRPPPPSP